MPGWHGTPRPMGPGTRPPPVAVYRAVISTDLQGSELVIADGLDRERVVSAIAQPPEWQPFGWPGITPQTEEALQRLAPMKLLTIFEFGAQIEGDIGDEIRAALFALHPALPSPSGDGDDHEFVRVPVTAEIFADGDFQGGYRYPEVGEPLPLRDDRTETFDRYLKDVVRADIRDRLRALRDKARPF